MFSYVTFSIHSYVPLFIMLLSLVLINLYKDRPSICFNDNGKLNRFVAMAL